MANDTYKINQRRSEALDQEMWEIDCEDVTALPTSGVPALSKAWELPTGKGYYFDGTTWKEIGGEE